jgi:hypothetical protein
VGKTAAKQRCVIVAGNGAGSSMSAVSRTVSMTGSRGRRGRGSIGAFVGRMFWRTWSRCHLMVDTDKGGCCRSDAAESPGKSGMKFRAITARSVERVGENNGVVSVSSAIRGSMQSCSFI